MKIGESSLLIWTRSWARHGAAAVGFGAAILVRCEAMFMSLLFALLGRIVVEDADDLTGGTVFSTAREVRLAFIQPDTERWSAMVLSVRKY